MNVHRTAGRRAVSGLTLVEVIASLVILSLLTIIGGSWIIGESRAIRSVNLSTTQTVTLARSLDAIRRDLSESASGSIKGQLDQNNVTMTTACPAPGADAGWREVIWRLNEQTHALERSEHWLNETSHETRTNIAIYDVASLTVESTPAAASDDGEPQILSIRVELTSGAAAELYWRME